MRKARGLPKRAYALWEPASRNRARRSDLFSMPRQEVCERLGCNLCELGQAVLILEFKGFTEQMVINDLPNTLVLKVINPARIAAAVNRIIEVS